MLWNGWMCFALSACACSDCSAAADVETIAWHITACHQLSCELQLTSLTVHSSTCWTAVLSTDITWMLWHCWLGDRKANLTPATLKVLWMTYEVPAWPGILWKYSAFKHKLSSGHQRLRSANRRQLVMPWHRRSKFGRRSFSIAAPMVWNSFPDSLRDPTLSIDNFRSTLKTHLFAAQRDT